MADTVQEEKTLSSLEKVITGGIVLLLVAFPITNVAVGAAYVHECPIAPILPAYLIVIGVVCLLLVGLFALTQPFPTLSDNKIWFWIVFFAFLFTLGWFFYGSYVVYTMFPLSHRFSTRPPRSVSSRFPPTISGYTQNSIHQLSSNSSHFTTAAPEYTDSPNSRFPPPIPSNQPDPSSDQNQTQSPSFNQTTTTTNTNQTLMSLIQTLALSNSSHQANREHLNTPRTGAVRSVTVDCDKNLYLFAFWTTTLIYVFVCISCAISAIHKKRQ
ncbi:uncharacterized protein LOC141799208 [Halichoeres trimaculatus]|uniref:uncharacterized protein LOC141799208 n=1 Tax=Halichoeres trimaculatus TaxID=147232 RepID=UPI003D9EA984